MDTFKWFNEIKIHIYVVKVLFNLINGVLVYEYIWKRKLIINFAQYFGVMPLNGLKSEDPAGIEFRWYSWRLLGTYAFLIWNFMVSAMFLMFLLKIGITPRNMVTLVFFTMSELSYFLFLLLAKKWPRIIKYWTIMEKRFLLAEYEIKDFNLSYKIWKISIIIGILALVEHAMFQTSTIHGFVTRLNECNIVVDDKVKYYYMRGNSHIFAVLPYHHIISAMLQVLSFTSTFIWNFMDLFIILISIGLTARFKQLHERLRRAMTANENQPKAFFREIRMDFVTLCELLRYVDKEMSFIILLSCLNNLYFICYQLMNIFDTLRYLINYAYFWYSLLYLIGRTAFLFLTAGALNEASKMPVDLLRSVSSWIWCEEIERYLHQINSETIALSAMGFFHFDRKLLFTMAGTIFTYELVILQLAMTSGDVGLPPLCD